MEDASATVHFARARGLEEIRRLALFFHRALRALKRMAELVDEGQRRGEIATQDRGGANIGVLSPDTVPTTLPDLGITRHLQPGSAVRARPTGETGERR